MDEPFLVKQPDGARQRRLVHAVERRLQVGKAESMGVARHRPEDEHSNGSHPDAPFAKLLFDIFHERYCFPANVRENAEYSDKFTTFAGTKEK